MNPLVTIAVPTYDRLHYLKEALASALAQTYAHVEVLVGDDGGSEELGEWCRALSLREPRVRYRRNPRRLGLAGNWNELVRAARGEFIVIIGDDDRLLPDFVEKLVALMRPGISVAFSNHYLIDAGGKRLEAESVRHTQRYRRDTLPAGEVESPAACVWRESVPLSAAMTRTEEMRRRPFKEDVNMPEIETFALLASEGGRFVFTPEYLSEYRTHAESYTAKGLTSETLVKYMLPIPVPPEVERDKSEFMAALLVGAVSRSLQKGDWEAARSLLDKEYYPHWRRLLDGGRARAARRQGVWRTLAAGCVQGLCAGLPERVGYPLYRSIRRVKAAVLPYR